MSPTQKNLLRAAVWLSLVGLMAASILPQGRSLTSDAPALLARARRLRDDLLDGQILGALSDAASLVVPQPPLGYLMAALVYLPGLERAAPLVLSFLALALVAVGLTLLSREERSPLGLPPLAAVLLLSASPLTWSAAEQVQWDILAAGWVALSLGALARSDDLRHPGWTLAAGTTAAAAALVKYNAPFFLWLPLLFATLRAAQQGRARDGARLIAAGVLPLFLWTPLALAELIPYLQASLAVGGTPLDSASEVPTLTERLLPRHLAYYPAVLKDAVGWPGLALCLAAPLALRRPSGRVALLAVVGGLLSLSLVGRREPRYLYPLLPLLLLCAEIGWGRLPHRALRLLLGLLVVAVGGTQLWGTASAYARWPEPTPLANLDFGPSNLQRWGRWPRPEIAFVPTSSLAVEWQVQEAVEAIGLALDGQDAPVGFLLYDNPRVPPADLFLLRAAEHGWVWDRWELQILSTMPHGGPPPRPEIRPGGGGGGGGGGRRDPEAPHRPGQPPPVPPEDETFLMHLEGGPFRPAKADPPFEILYAIHPRGEPFYGAFLLQLGAEEVTTFALPRGFVGEVWRLDASVWANPIGQQIRDTQDHDR